MTAKSFLLGGSALLTLTIAACDNVRVPGDDSADTTAAVTTDTPEAANDVTTASLADNPLLQDWDTPYGVPPFAEIADEDYMPAVEAGIAAWQADIEAIKANEDPASFENTIVALDKAGSTLGKVMLVFGNITNTDTNDTLSALEAEIYPMVTQVSDSIVFDDQLFARVKTVYDARETLGLDEQDARLVEADSPQCLDIGRPDGVRGSGELSGVRQHGAVLFGKVRGDFPSGEGTGHRRVVQKRTEARPVVIDSIETVVFGGYGDGEHLALHATEG